MPLFLLQVVNRHGTTCKTNQKLWAFWVSDFEEKVNSTLTPSPPNQKHTYTPGNDLDCDTICFLAAVTGLITTSLLLPTFKHNTPQRKTTRWWRHSRRCFLSFIQVKEVRNSKTNCECWIKALGIQTPLFIITSTARCGVVNEVLEYMRNFYPLPFTNYPSEIILSGLVGIRDALIPDDIFPLLPVF